jgi:hypothetical protein
MFSRSDAAANLAEILRLNQRGGRPLTLLDLIEAHTVDEEVAALLVAAAASGRSLLTAARPGNAGKTTLLAATLAFLPPERRILTAADPRLLGHVPSGACLLAHEIGAGPYYAYLWGEDARRFCAAAGPAIAVASCIHADTLEELQAILCGPPIGITAEAFCRLDLIAFLRLDRTPTGYRRRVSAVYVAGPDGAAHRCVFRWEEAGDRFVAEAPVTHWGDAIERARDQLAALRAAGARDFETLFARVQSR